MLYIMLPSILFWLIIFPSSCKFHVTDASLTQFNLRSNNTLDYNLKVSITVRNPNNNIIVYYGRITSIAWYKDNDFSWVSLTPFGQCRKNTTFLQAVFEGKSVIKHKSKELGEYKDETKSEPTMESMGAVVSIHPLFSVAAKEKKVKTTDDLLSKEDWLSEPHSLSEASSSLSG
ncbi:NDR1/HIN1-like protein 10 [Glycine max]|nr:NDR1/HIN1-like protein 10 [Glycine max]